MRTRKFTQFIVMHCSATRALQDIGAREIRNWHKAKGWQDIGYHFVIRRDGTVEKGRQLDKVGSHVAGHNHYSVGVCMVGGIGEDMQPADNFTRSQWASAKRLVAELRHKYLNSKVVGHRDFPGVKKACPCFNARAWAAAEGLQ